MGGDALYGQCQSFLRQHHLYDEQEKFDGLSAADQKAMVEAAREAEKWLKPRYEQWINERVGSAVMQGGGAAVSISKDEQEKLIGSVRTAWTKRSTVLAATRWQIKFAISTVAIAAKFALTSPGEGLEST